jgi:hypothetical protein
MFLAHVAVRKQIKMYYAHPSPKNPSNLDGK